MLAMVLREKLNEALQVAQNSDPKLTWYQVAKLGQTSYGNLKDAMAGNRPLSDEMLRAIASVPILGVSENTLKAWRILDEGPEIIEIAHEELLKEKERRGIND